MQGINPTSLGASSLDVEGLVDQLITSEGAPAQNRLDRKEIEAQTSISALGTFRGTLSEFQDSIERLRNTDDFHKIAASSSDEEKVAIIATNKAQQGAFSIEVLQLAQSHRLTSESFESRLDPVGTGNLSFQFGSIDPQSGRFIVNSEAPVKNIQIKPENNSLLGIAQAINEAGFGVRASIINDGNGHRLALSNEATGEVNTMRIVVNDNDGSNSNKQGLSRLAFDVTNPLAMNMIETSEPQDAKVRLDGIEIRSASNTIDDALDGITLDLLDTTGKTPVRLSTVFDTQGINDSINQFVATYNEMIGTIETIAGFNPETGEAGPLSGDSAVRGISQQIRRIVGASFNGVNEDYGSLSSIGIDTQRDGRLVINNSQLQSAIDEDMSQVTKLFARSGASSDPLIDYVSASDEAIMGKYAVSINQLASQGQYISRDLGPAQAVSINAGQNNLILKVDGATSSSISIPAAEYNSGDALADELQRQINSNDVFRREGISVSVEFMLGQFVIKSNRLGSQSRVDVISAGDSLKDIGFDSIEGLAGKDVQGFIGSLPAEGNGQQLTGTAEARGIRIKVLGGQIGERGEVSFAKGVAEQLSNAMSMFLGADGLLQSRTDGLNDRIEDLNRQREQLGRRLAVSEERLLKQFSNLDATLGRMRSTSTFLENQLAGLPGAPGKNNG